MIVNAFERFEDIPGFATVVPLEELERNDRNLNIRRYADNAPLPEPHDVRAHLEGVCRSEVEDLAPLFQAHGFDPTTLFQERDARYLDFKPGVASKADIKARIEADVKVKAREDLVKVAFDTWGGKNQDHLVGLPRAMDLMAVRAALLAGFVDAIVPLGLLDRFHVAGVAARGGGRAV